MTDKDQPCGLEYNDGSYAAAPWAPAILDGSSTSYDVNTTDAQ